MSNGNDFGLTAIGFRRKRFPDVLASMEARARNLFGESINLTESSPLGVILRITAWSIAVVWQLAERVYYSAFLDTATGYDLDRVCQYLGLARRPAAYARGNITAYGDPGALVPVGLLMSTADGVTFRVTEVAEILPVGQVIVPIQAIELGLSGNVPPDTITRIVTPEPGIDSITNEMPTYDGRRAETDDELRARYALSVSIVGASTVDSIRASLLAVDGVRAALVVPNSTMETIEGRPPKSIECYVLGGFDGPIADAIFATKAAGIQAYGDIEVEVMDSAGQIHFVSFTRATEIEIEVDITLWIDFRFPGDGLAQVRTAIVRYIGGEDTDGQMYAGLGMGDDVIHTRLILAAYSVPGMLDVTITVNIVGEAPGTANIPIDIMEVAETQYGLVTIEAIDSGFSAPYGYEGNGGESSV